MTKLEECPDSNIMEMKEYNDLLNGLASFDILYCLTNPTHYAPDTKTNTPMVANLPNIGMCLYIFTDLDAIEAFEKKFNRTNAYIKLTKEDCEGTGPYDSVFQIARFCGVNRLMVHSASDVIPIEISHFMEAAKLTDEPQVRSTVQDLEELLSGGKKRIYFNQAAVCTLNELVLEKK